MKNNFNKKWRVFQAIIQWVTKSKSTSQINVWCELIWFQFTILGEAPQRATLETLQTPSHSIHASCVFLTLHFSLQPCYRVRLSALNGFRWDRRLLLRWPHRVLHRAHLQMFRVPHFTVSLSLLCICLNASVISLCTNCIGSVIVLIINLTASTSSLSIFLCLPVCWTRVLVLHHSFFCPLAPLPPVSYFFHASHWPHANVCSMPNTSTYPAPSLACLLLTSASLLMGTNCTRLWRGMQVMLCQVNTLPWTVPFGTRPSLRRSMSHMVRRTRPLILKIFWILQILCKSLFRHFWVRLLQWKSFVGENNIK